MSTGTSTNMLIKELLVSGQIVVSYQFDDSQVSLMLHREAVFLLFSKQQNRLIDLYMGKVSVKQSLAAEIGRFQQNQGRENLVFIF